MEEQNHIKVSIIIPNYNHHAFLEQRIKCIFNQTFQNFELILLDDCSTDNSIEILANYATHPKVSHFRVNSHNSGSPFKQWQKGIELAKGEYVWIAESDDYCESSFLEKALNYHNKVDQEVGLVYCQSVDVDENEKFISNRLDWTSDFNPNIWIKDFVLPGKDFINNYLKVKNVIPNASAVIFKKSLVNKKTFSGTISEMKMCGDWLFWIKISAGTNIGFISEPLNFFRNHSGVSRKHIDKNKKIIRLSEEAEVRNFISVNFETNQETELTNLYKRWFNLFRYRGILNKQFYSIKNKDTSYLSLLLKFLQKN